jgi:hypothetical protein
MLVDSSRVVLRNQSLNRKPTTTIRGFLVSPGGILGSSKWFRPLKRSSTSVSFLLRQIVTVSIFHWVAVEAVLL